MHQILGKVLSPSDLVILGGPAGGSALERASPPKGIFHMTRRAFLALKSNTGAGEIVIKRGCESFMRKVVQKFSFSKISRDPLGGF